MPSYLNGNLARALELMGRYVEALAIYDQAINDAAKASRLDSKLFALLGSASADCELGEIDRADRALAEARAAMQGVFPPGSPPALTAAGLEGRVALALGQLDDAKRVFTSTINVHEAQGQPGGGVVCSTFTALMWRYGSNSRRRLYRMQNGHPTWPAACRAALPTRAEPA